MSIPVGIPSQLIAFCRNIAECKEEIDFTLKSLDNWEQQSRAFPPPNENDKKFIKEVIEDRKQGIMNTLREIRTIRKKKRELQEKVRAIAKLCVDKGLPGGDPCWISKMICAYIPAE
jgi:hypothetical protein